MKIDTRFSVGEEVFFINEKNMIEKRDCFIESIRVEVNRVQKKTEIKYSIERDPLMCSTIEILVDESRIFSTIEEATDGLLELNGISKTGEPV